MITRLGYNLHLSEHISHYVKNLSGCYFRKYIDFCTFIRLLKLYIVSLSVIYFLFRVIETL